MILAPYGRPLGLLCAVTDVTHVNYKDFLLHFMALLRFPLLPLICRMAGESAPRWSDKVCPPSCPSTLKAPDFVFGERDHLKCPVQPAAAALGPCNSSAQKKREGQGLGAPLCGAPPVAFLLFVPIDEGVDMRAVAFVYVVFWWGCAVDGGALLSTFSHLICCNSTHMACMQTDTYTDKCAVQSPFNPAWSCHRFIHYCDFSFQEEKNHNILIVYYVVKNLFFT